MTSYLHNVENPLYVHVGSINLCRGKQILSGNVKMVARVLALFWSSSLITVSPFPYSQVVVFKSTWFVSY